VFALFDKQVEYFYDCQPTPLGRARLDWACDEALDLLEKA